MSYAIDIRNLSFRYRDANEFALSGLNLKIKENQFVVIMGKSGAGKSTLCFCFNRIIPQLIKGEFSGSVSLFNKDIAGHKTNELSEIIGIVFQDFETQLVCISVEQEIAFPMENLGFNREEMRKTVEEMIRFINLQGRENDPPSSLSGGQKQKLAIASMLATKPKILALDEPTTDLDPAGKMMIFNLMKMLKGNMTIIMVEHEVEEIMEADRVIILGQGKLIFEGSPEDIFTKTDLLLQNGIKPLEVSEIALNLNFNKEIPLRIEQLCQLIEEKNIKFNERKYKSLLEKDENKKNLLGEEIIRAENINYRYEGSDQFALREVSFSIKKGEFVSILGQNGCGKTTLAKHLNGLCKLQQGTLNVWGKDLYKTGTKELCRLVGYVFQNPDHQIFASTVWDEIAFGPKMLGFDEKEIKNLVEEALVGTGLMELKDEDPLSLPKGDRQRVAVASVLASNPQIIVLDEPTTGLDFIQLLKMMELLVKLHHQGKTIIMITHCMWIAARFSDRIMVMHQGQIIMDDTPRNIFGNFELLSKADLKPPQSVLVSQRLWGKTLLSPEEFALVCEVDEPKVSEK